MTLRVMWLLNHTSARKFEIPMLKRCGVSQIYLPKSVPNDISFRSSSVSYEEDEHLEIPGDELAILNACDWYEGATPGAWAIANKYFDAVFIILHNERLLGEIDKYFKGLVLCRAYGLLASLTYSEVIRQFHLEARVRSIYPRFYFAEAYSHLADVEARYISNRRLYLPLGLDSKSSNVWEGLEEKIYFVCPSIGHNVYYKEVFNEFKKNFSEFDFVVAGEQLVPVSDPRVLGFIAEDIHRLHMTQSRVMFYHSQEPNHIHYHPFEAILAGMPLVFMAGGMLDRMGGARLPGRVRSFEEARKLIRRLMDGDKDLIKTIRTSQDVLLRSMDVETLTPHWKRAFRRLEDDLRIRKESAALRPPSKLKRIAVILPEGYRGGTLRGAVMLANAIFIGSRQSNEAAEVVFAYREDANVYEKNDFNDLDEGISRRPFHWKYLSAAEASRAMHFAGHEAWHAESSYSVPEDGMRQFMDCDAWVIVSDRVTTPLLPVRPIVIMIYDYLQRYEYVMSRHIDVKFLQAARSADRVLVTTQFTNNDALQYAGINPQKLARVPMLVPQFSCNDIPEIEVSVPYFIWTTNAAPHKNHSEVVKALKIYYEEYGGSLICKITGVGTKSIPEGRLPHLKHVATLLEQSPLLRAKLHWMGDLPDGDYRSLLKAAQFLMHAARIDNGTFSVIEAAQLGIPSLSSNYPAMREMNARFSLNLAFMDVSSAGDMAKMLNKMESNCQALRARLPDASVFTSNNLANCANKYWEEVRKCL